MNRSLRALSGLGTNTTRLTFPAKFMKKFISGSVVITEQPDGSILLTPPEGEVVELRTYKLGRGFGDIALIKTRRVVDIDWAKFLASERGYNDGMIIKMCYTTRLEDTLDEISHIDGTKEVFALVTKSKCYISAAIKSVKDIDFEDLGIEFMPGPKKKSAADAAMKPVAKKETVAKPAAKKKAEPKKAPAKKADAKPKKATNPYKSKPNAYDRKD